MQYLEYYKPTVKKNKRQDIFVLYFLPLEWSEAPSWSRTPSETASRFFREKTVSPPKQT